MGALCIYCGENMSDAATCAEVPVETESGQWRFSDIHEHTEDDYEAVPLRILFHLDHGVGEVLDLSPGELAWRDGSGGAWRRATVDSLPG